MDSPGWEARRSWWRTECAKGWGRHGTKQVKAWGAVRCVGKQRGASGTCRNPWGVAQETERMREEGTPPREDGENVPKLLREATRL